MPEPKEQGAKPTRAPRAPRAPKAETPAAAPEQPKQPAAERPGTGQRRAAPARQEAPKAPPPQAPPEPSGPYTPRLLARYRTEIAPALMKEFAYKNIMEVPRVEKVVLNVGLGEAKDNPKAVESVDRDLSAITGQHPVQTKAKKSIANFKVRQGMVVGMMVTLRGHRMYDFLDRLVNVALPRIRDFRGIPKNGFDGRGGYSLGIREQTMFPEIDFNSIDRIRGMQLSVATTAKNDEQARRLLDLLGFAFVKDESAGRAA